MGFGGVALRFTSTFFYALEFCCAGIIIGIYSYFLAVLADRDQPIARDWKAVEGISGVAVIYTILAVILTFCLGGVKIFAFLAILLDVAFCGAFIAIAVLTRDGAHSCTGASAPSPLGNGPADNQASGFGGSFGFGNGSNATYQVSNGTACKLNTAAFAVSIAGAVLFLISALLQVLVSRHHQKEKKYGPSPANNYTSGSGKRKFWQRKPKNTAYDGNKEAAFDGNNDAELGPVGTTGMVPAGTTTVGAAPLQPDYRPSHDTGLTGSTMGQGDAAYNTTKYDHAGYHTGPTGTAATANPYGYNNTATNY